MGEFHFRLHPNCCEVLTGIAKFSQKFLEDRQVRLQRFLRTVMLHPEMGKGGERSVVGAWILGESPTHYD